MQAIFVETALKGTLNVLESCVKARPKRIVLTSSIVSCLLTPKNVPGAVIDETFVTDPDFVRKVIPVGLVSQDHFIILKIIGNKLTLFLDIYWLSLLYLHYMY